MKVKELIKELYKMNNEANIFIQINNRFGGSACVQIKNKNMISEDNSDTVIIDIIPNQIQIKQLSSIK